MTLATFDVARSLPMSSLYLVGLSSFVTYLFYKVYSFALRPKGYPPGPPSVPVLGNLSQLPATDPHLQYTAWSKQYGELFSLNFGAIRIIMLSSKRAVREVLEKKSQTTSRRMDTFYRETTNNLNIINKDNDDNWRRHRRMYHLRLHSKKSDSYVPYQEFEAVQFLINMLDDPDRYDNHISQYTTSIASTIFYGVRWTPITQGLVAGLKQWMAEGTKAQTPQLVDFYPFFRPIFRLIPTALSSYKQILQDILAIEDRVFLPMVQKTKENMEKGNDAPCFVRDCLNVDEKDRLTDFEIAQSAAHGSGAAVDTQWSTIRGCLSGLFHYPEALRAAQAELDAVVGADRLPSWADREQLPVMRGVVEEALRWTPTGFTGIPHVLSRDETFEELGGYVAAKGTVLLTNNWALANDVPDSRRFDPLRYDAEDTLNEQIGVIAESSKRNHFAFGAGRRVCPGYNVAQRGLFTLLSRFIWAFDIGPKIGPDGKAIKVSQDEYTQGLAPRVKLWDCSITPRDEHRAAFVRKAWADAQKDSLDSDGLFAPSFMENIIKLGNEK